MKIYSADGRVFEVNERGQVVDEDGFFTSSTTCKHPICKTCVSVKIDQDTIQVRDTKDPKKITLSFTHEEWEEFIKGAKNGEFDL